MNALGLPLLDEEVEDAALGARSFKDYCRITWPQVVQGVQLVWGYENDALTEHLEAVTRGEIQQLIINMPPRNAKSTFTDVLWPSWEWIAHGFQRFVFSSYDLELSTRDSVLCRGLVQSPWYQRRWGAERPKLAELSHLPPVEIAADENLKTSFTLRAGGMRYATSVGGGVTGRGGNRMVVDDPVDPRGAFSEAKRAAFIQWWDYTWLSRRDDVRKAALVVVMQRLHARDPSGWLLDKDPSGWVHLNLPMEHDDQGCVVQVPHRCSLRPEGTHPALRTARDQRTELGQPLNPERNGPEEIKKLKRSLSDSSYSGAYQQRPSPKGGSLVRRAWFPVRREADLPPASGYAIRAWDLAGTREDEVGADDPAWTVGLRLSRRPPFWVVEHVVREREDATGVRKLILSTAISDGRRVRISIPKDPAQAGKDQAKQIAHLLSGFMVKVTPPSEDKVLRAQGWIDQAGAGNFALLPGTWNDALLDELAEFPLGAHDDQADALSDAFNVSAASTAGLVVKGMRFGANKRGR